MKDIKKGIVDVILYVIVFAVVQVIVNYIGMFVWSWIKHIDFGIVQNMMLKGNNPVLLALTSVFSSMITLVVFLKTGWTTLTRDYLLSKPWATLFWVVLFALGAIIPLEFVYEHIGLEMEKDTERIFEGLMKEPWGYVAGGILAPLVEEIVFRGAILRTLLGLMSKKNHWVAILISAAIFGVVHGNLAQFVNALVMGLVLGWMYYRTGSLVPGILLHWVNNTVAYVLANVIPQSNEKLIDVFGGDEKTVYYAVGFSLCILIPSFLQLLSRLKKVGK